jgi:hypothetical protein
LEGRANHQAIAAGKGQTMRAHVRRETEGPRNVRPVTLTSGFDWLPGRRTQGPIAFYSPDPRRFGRVELSQLTVMRQAVDGQAAGFDNRLFVK